MPQPHGPWTILQRREVYRDPWVALVRDEVLRPDGKPGSYAVTHIKPGVTVMAIDDQANVHLTEEFHYGVGRVTLELVSGGIDVGETAAAAAERELREELGITARRWTSLGVTDPFTANVVSPTNLFLAEDITIGCAQPEGSEQIRHVVMPLGEVINAVRQGQISHAPSALLIMLAGLHVGYLAPVDLAPR